MLDLTQMYNGYFLEKSILSIMPETVLIVFAFIILLLGLFKNVKNVENSYYLALIGTAFSFLYLFMLSNRTIHGFYGSIIFDKFDIFFFTAILLSGFFTLLMSKNYFDTRNVLIPEYYSLVLFSVSAMMLLVSSVNLIMIFLSIEFMSIAAYILTGYLKGESRSTEGAMKYFILGTFASAFLLFGSVFIYAATGHLNLYKIHNFIFRQNYDKIHYIYNLHTFLAIGLILFLIGLAFKMSLFPFHTWTPDSYDGAPTPVTNLMATGIKIAAFGVFIRVFTSIYGLNVLNFYNILWILAILTMTFGNFAALLQTDLKRLIAYSSIAQAGYILMGIIAGGYYGISGTLFYLLAYIFMTAGAFAIVVMFENLKLASVNIKSYHGFGFKYPFTAAAFSFFLLSLAGIPVTAGFMGKFFVFTAAIKSGYYWLVFIALLNSAFAAYYYFKIIVKMYMIDNQSNNSTIADVIDSSNGTSANGQTELTKENLAASALVVAIIICLIFTLLLGVYPQPFINFAAKSVTSLWNI